MFSCRLLTKSDLINIVLDEFDDSRPHEIIAELITCEDIEAGIISQALIFTKHVEGQT